MVCKSCGNDNPETNRFCGMCGVRLEAKTEPAPAAAAPAPEVSAPARAPQPPPPSIAGRVAAATSRSQQSSILGLEQAESASPKEHARSNVTGPSFLGLNDEPDPHDAYYLLDDEGEGGHAGLLIASVLVIVIAVLAFHYRAPLSAMAGPLYAAALERVHPQAQAPAAPPAPAPAAADNAAAAPAAPPAAANAASPTPSAAAPPAAPEEKPAPEAKAAEAAAAPAANPPEEAAPEAKAKDITPKEKATEPVREARVSRPKPHAAEPAPPQNDAVLKLAQKYLHGQGVPQDCTTGMAYLREANKHPNPEAASQMGALYATGTCVPEDRVAAYRWFTSAMQMAPDNQYLGAERDKLYGQMTSAERHQADRQQ